MAGIVGVPWRVGAFRWVTLAGAAVFRCAAQEAKAATARLRRGRLCEVDAAGPGVYRTFVR